MSKNFDESILNFLKCPETGKKLFFDRKYFFTDSLKDNLLLNENDDLMSTSKFLFNKSYFLYMIIS